MTDAQDTSTGEAPVLLITGASSGIGAATARAAVADGYRAVLVARSSDVLSELAAEFGGPSRALPAVADVRDFAQLEAAVAQGVEAFGAVDAVFACAGVAAVRGFRNDSLERWRAVAETNILGTALTVRASIDALRAASGQFVLMGSTYARAPAAGSIYSASKAAVRALADGARQEFQGAGVRVTLIEAGTTDTPFFDNPQADGLHPDDVARAVLWALRQPAHVDVGEVVVRATAQR